MASVNGKGRPKALIARARRHGRHRHTSFGGNYRFSGKHRRPAGRQRVRCACCPPRQCQSRRSSYIASII